MFLKSLEIKGFKSFADNIIIELKPGINIVVGPNGCGKSNIVDAIRWVLGEANVRNIRGQKSSDVIFNGSDRKRALGMASVEITIDNSDHSLDLDYSEITLGRKLYRSGESEFFINKIPVRLRDVANLFMGTGLGKKGYSIISQGELEQVLNGQPMDRRLLLEEASGIIKYRQQRDEVRKRIDSTSSDLLRLGDILDDLKEQKEQLCAKAERARKYTRISEECAELEELVLRSQIAKCRRDLEKKSNELKIRTLRYEQVKTEVEKLEQKAQKEQDLLNLAANRLKNLKEEKFSIQSKIQSLESEIRLGEERIKNYQERIKAAQADETKYLKMLNNLTSDLEKNNLDFQQEQKKYEESLQKFMGLQVEVEKLKEKNIQLQELLEKKKELVFYQKSDETQIKNKIVELEERITRTVEKKERVTIHLKSNQEKLDQLSQQLTELAARQKTKEDLQQKAQQKVNSIKEQVDKEAEQLKNAEEKLRRINQEKIKVENRLFALKDMKQNLEGYSAGVKAIMAQSHKKAISGLLGIWGEIIDIPPGMETAIETAVGRAVENIIVKTADDAQWAIEYLKTNKLGRVTFLPLDSLKVTKISDRIIDTCCQQKGVIGLASRLVRFDQVFQKAVDYHLGRVLITEDLTVAVNVFKKFGFPIRIVTLQGDMVSMSGAMTGGLRNSEPITPLKRRKEENALNLELAEINQKQKKYQEESLKISMQIKKIEEAAAAVTSEMTHHRIESEMLAQQIHQLENDQKNYWLELEELASQAAALEKSATDLETEKLKLLSRQEIAKKQSDRAATELEEIKEQMTLTQREYEVLKERLESTREQIEMKKRELGNIEKSRDKFMQVKESYQQTSQEVKDIKNRLTKETNLQKQKNERLAELLKDTLASLDDIMQWETETQGQEKTHKVNLEQISHQMVPLLEEKSGLEKSIHYFEIEKTRLETELINLCQKESGRENKGELIELSPSKLNEYRERISTLKKQLAELEPVDISAITEYQETKEKFEFIKDQFNDLVKARDSLNKLINETEEKMMDQFNIFLAEAGESFNRTFCEIFNGGEARLTLEEENRLEAGVEIKVKMPGKKSQHLNLLSGGERALTCIALVFSLLRLKPVPFCLLDEIDASLDETNLIRFNRFIQEMANQLQFIIITHRQSTIAIGSQIYGVTMAEEGISSIFTLDARQAESIAG